MPYVKKTRIVTFKDVYHSLTFPVEIRGSFTHIPTGRSSGHIKVGAKDARSLYLTVLTLKGFNSIPHITVKLTVLDATNTKVVFNDKRTGDWLMNKVDYERING
jgi:hypothetical protein